MVTLAIAAISILIDIGCLRYGTTISGTNRKQTLLKDALLPTKIYKNRLLSSEFQFVLAMASLGGILFINAVLISKFLTTEQVTPMRTWYHYPRLFFAIASVVAMTTTASFLSYPRSTLAAAVDSNVTLNPTHARSVLYDLFTNLWKTSRAVLKVVSNLLISVKLNDNGGKSRIEAREKMNHPKRTPFKNSECGKYCGASSSPPGSVKKDAVGGCKKDDDSPPDNDRKRFHVSSNELMFIVAFLGSVFFIITTKCMSMRNVQSAAEQATQMRNYLHTSFYFVALSVAMVVVASSSFSFPRSRLADVAFESKGTLSPTYAQSAPLKTSSAVLEMALSSLLFLKSNGDGGIIRTKAKRKPPRRTFLTKTPPNRLTLLKAPLLLLGLLNASPTMGDPGHKSIKSFNYASSVMQTDIAKIGSPDDVQDIVSANKFFAVQDELSEARSNLELVVSGTSTTDSDTLRASAEAMSLVKDRLTELQLSAAMPNHLQRVLESSVNQLTNAERHVQKLEGLVSKHSGHDASLVASRLGSTTSTHRSLSSTEKHHFKAGLTKADYHHRATGYHLVQGMHGLANHLGHHGNSQQGYRNARISREMGTTTHRRLDTNTNVCLPTNQEQRKIEQCYRLATCTEKYTLYDMYGFFFADDLEIETGQVDDKIQVNDESELRVKLSTVIDLSEDILDQFDADNQGNPFLKTTTPKTTAGDPLIVLAADECVSLEDPELCGVCDELLQNFHRVDEGLGIAGKWGGASVTGVCRGWGTNKFVSLDSIYTITAENLNKKALVEDCIEDEVATFNEKSRNDGIAMIFKPEFCTDESYFKVELLDNMYCCASANCEDQCGVNECSNLADGMCCSEDTPCRLGEGDCNSDEDCVSGLVCGSDNCQKSRFFSQGFGWVNGTAYFDCCIMDYFFQGQQQEPAQTTCGDENCVCTVEEIVQFIEDNNGDCDDVDDVDCMINPRIVQFDRPEQFCTDVLNANTDALFDDNTTKTEAMDDINDAFKCLYYSAFENSYGEGTSYDCDDLYQPDGQRLECKTACDNRKGPIFGVKTSGDSKKRITSRVCDSADTSECDEGEPVTEFGNAGTYYVYDIPTTLPPLDDRLSLLAGESLGRFDPFDIVETATDETAAEFVIDVFQEYMTCSANLVDKLGRNIFSGANNGTNPYAKDNDGQFYLPRGISNAATDDHGQIKDGEYLDLLFKYVKYGENNGIVDNGDGSLTFSDDLRALFIDVFVYNSVSEKIEEYEECIEANTNLENSDSDDPTDLGICAGDCNDDDGQCAGLLECFKRDEKGPRPPGCGGGSLKNSFDYCYDPFCTEQKARLEGIRNGLSNEGLSSSTFFDESIALLWGNETTIGQICAYSRGLTEVVEDDVIVQESTVDDIPGFCCLDAPYETNDWGETFSCQKYVADTSVGAAQGSAVVVQKSLEDDCNNPGPVTAGFNQAACDVPFGTWCPTPRDCKELVICVRDEIEEVKKDESRPAFLQYLEDAPQLNLQNNENTDPTKCGDLREYFEYDRAYADDDRICEEVKDLKCLTDFSNLDSLVTGVEGAEDSAADVQLAVSEVLVENFAENPCSDTAAKAYRSIIYAFQKIVEFFEFLDETALEPSKAVCEAIPFFVALGTGSDAARTFCIAPVIVVRTSTKIALYAAKLLLDIADRIYGELCTPADDTWETPFQAGRQGAIYQNGITNHGNIIQTFYATQQLKVMLGDIGEGLEGDREADDNGRRRRLLVEDCTDTTDGFLERGSYPELCNNTSCQDETKLCDGTDNYPFVAYLIAAGCDNLDSDGDKLHDICEDRYAPSIVLRNAEIFRCDDDDTKKLCNTDRWFKSEKQVHNFLGYNFPAADDCAPSTKLDVKIDYERGTCGDTVYTLTPFQDYSGCANQIDVGPFNLTFVNPLFGASKNVTVQLDDEAPTIECGFLPSNANTLNVIEGNTLYHYMTKSDENGMRLTDARLYYNATDNCEEEVDINIKVVVESNEIQQNKIGTAELFNKRRNGTVDQAGLLYAPTHCDCKNNLSRLCKTDPTMGELKTRLYDVTVTASDSAENSDTAVCKVVIVPFCNPSDKGSVVCEVREGASYYTMAVVEASIMKSEVHNEIAKTELDWVSGLETPDPNDKVGEVVVDSDPPEVECSLHTEELTGNGAGVFTDLGFSFTAFDTGDKCTATEDLKVRIKVLSNEMVTTGGEMVIISEPRVAGESPAVWVEDSTCTSSNGKCKISSSKKSREYVVRVTATDEAGNVGIGECSTVVGNQVVDASDPLFLLTKLDITGGLDEVKMGEGEGEAGGIFAEPDTSSQSLSRHPTLRPNTATCAKTGHQAPGGCATGVNNGCCGGRCLKNTELCK